MCSSYSKYLADSTTDNQFVELINQMNSFSGLVNECVINGKITSLTAADLDQGELLAETCRSFGQTSIQLLEKFEHKNDLSNETKQLNDLAEKIQKILYELLPKVHDINKQEIGDLIDQEMHNTSEAIEAAVAKLEVN